MVRLIYHPDFAEGVRALLIEKTGDPQWQPSEPTDISDEEVDAFFEPLPEDERWTPLES